jgi:hypothetical protein
MTTKIFSDEQLRDKDIDTLKRYLRYKLGGYRVALADIRTDNVLYRGVPWQQRPGKIDDVSYPPADRVTKLGRVNRIGKPVFYCSRALGSRRNICTGSLATSSERIETQTSKGACCSAVNALTGTPEEEPPQPLVAP